MELACIKNFRLVDRNKAAADVYFKVKDSQANQVKAEFIFYLQGCQCLSIRVGRHDPEISTQSLENYIKNNSRQLRAKVQPDVERVKKEREVSVYGEIIP